MGHRRRKPPPPPRPKRRVLLFLSIPVLLFLSLRLPSSVLRRANSLGRRCAPERPFLPPNAPSTQRLRIAMATFSFSGGREDGLSRRRSFEGLADLAGRNKRGYAERMGYGFVDAERLVDPHRPPSWSKIPAVRSCLGDYDWVFWNDADTIVTNFEISLENILESAIGHMDFNASPDLVVTEDINGVNAGVFFVRSSDWSKNFLDMWWNQTSFIQFGSTKSGDNAAMKHLIDNLSPGELQEHVSISSMQCLFNSYPWSLTWRSVIRLVCSPHAIWRGTYSKGDFILHLAGFDNKKEWAAKILQEINVEKL
ncbi:putative alpha-1,6-mannosyltransferase MNN10 isoform X1 [Iris pallida]|uniref:Alpha-1,6-mannosyltransferase MNN10 isoform X1 n=1 Tax=Iris pallida TaxID=29817 RepID=A0AAX6F123_IRIPA|nr:putative alpha-1,6-mannosyltransferase MNN10 isoform X1 [Iris pallida]